AIRNSSHSQLPTLLSHVNPNHYRRDHREQNRKQGKRRQKLPHKVRIEQRDRPQQPPHPLPPLVCILHSLSSIPLQTTWVVTASPLPFLLVDLHFLRCVELA